MGLTKEVLVEARGKACRENAINRIKGKIISLQRQIDGLEKLERLLESQEELEIELDEIVWEMVCQFRAR